MPQQGEFTRPNADMDMATRTCGPVSMLRLKVGFRVRVKVRLVVSKICSGTGLIHIVRARVRVRVRVKVRVRVGSCVFGKGGVWGCLFLI